MEHVAKTASFWPTIKMAKSKMKMEESGELDRENNNILERRSARLHNPIHF